MPRQPPPVPDSQHLLTRLSLPRPYREIRARQTSTSLTLYQAYSPYIALPAVKAQSFLDIPAFSTTRMTWVKPSFLWMMYRSGWAEKDSRQSRILAITVSKDGFTRLLTAAQESYDAGHLEPQVDGQEKPKPDVVIQWDPERDVDGNAVPWRSLQMGIRGETLQTYLKEYIEKIEDVTDTCKQVRVLVQEGRFDEAMVLAPTEEPFPTGKAPRVLDA